MARRKSFENKIDDDVVEEGAEATEMKKFKVLQDKVPIGEHIYTIGDIVEMTPEDAELHRFHDVRLEDAPDDAEVTEKSGPGIGE